MKVKITGKTVQNTKTMQQDKEKFYFAKLHYKINNKFIRHLMLKYTIVSHLHRVSVYTIACAPRLQLDVILIVVDAIDGSLLHNV